MSHGFLVLCDVDGILADFVAAAIAMIERRFAIHYTPEQVDMWDFASLPGFQAIKDEFWEMTQGVGFASSIPVFPGAVEGIERLRTIADVEFLTSPMHGSKTWVHERNEWLERYFDAHHKDVMHVHRKERVPGRVLIDDKIEHIANWESAHPNGLGLLWDRPYNRGTAHTVVSDWETVYNVVHDLKVGHNLRELRGRSR
jgi:5'(3')-deoxyribonucleotidase